MDFLKIVVTLPVFELGICSLHQNGIEFKNKLIDKITSEDKKTLLTKLRLPNV